MVVAGWVEGEDAKDLARVSGDDADVSVGDEHDDGGSGVGSADADVVESAVVAQRDFALVVDAVAADPMFGFGVRGRSGLGESGVGDLGCGPAQ